MHKISFARNFCSIHPSSPTVVANVPKTMWNDNVVNDWNECRGWRFHNTFDVRTQARKRRRKKKTEEFKSIVTWVATNELAFEIKNWLLKAFHHMDAPWRLNSNSFLRASSCPIWFDAIINMVAWKRRAIRSAVVLRLDFRLASHIRLIASHRTPHTAADPLLWIFTSIFAFS